MTNLQRSTAIQEVCRYVNKGDNPQALGLRARRRRFEEAKQKGMIPKELEYFIYNTILCLHRDYKKEVNTKDLEI